jgi:hypothetical protein
LSYVLPFFVEQAFQKESVRRGGSFVGALCWRIRRSVGSRRDLLACRRESFGATVAAKARFVAFEFTEPYTRIAPRFPYPVSNQRGFIQLGDLPIL